MAAWKRSVTGSIFIVYKILSSWLWILYLRALEGQLSEKLICLGMWKFQVLIIKSKYEKRAPHTSLLTRGPRLWIKGHEVPLSRTWVVPMSRTCRGKAGVKSVPQIWDLSQTKDMQRDQCWVGGGWIPRNFWRKWLPAPCRHSPGREGTRTWIMRPAGAPSSGAWLTPEEASGRVGGNKSVDTLGEFVLWGYYWSHSMESLGWTKGPHGKKLVVKYIPISRTFHLPKLKLCPLKH